MRYENILKTLNEHAPAGATCAGNVSVAVTALNQNTLSRSLGVGFNPDGNWGVYEINKEDKHKKGEKKEKK